MTTGNARTASRRFLVAALGVGALALASDAVAQPLKRTAITAPRLNAQIGSSVYYLRWQGVRGARTYLLRVSEIGAPTGTYWINEYTRGTSYAFKPASFDARGSRFQMSVYACREEGVDCSDRSHVSAYVLGPPVVVSSPSSGYTYSGTDRRPQFSWQPYSGLKPSSGGGGVTYTITFAGNGAPAQSFTTQSTSFQPPVSINPAFQNPVRWSVKACKSYNCSSSGGTRTLNLTASSFDELTGYIEFDSPPNGVTVDVGSELRWKKKAGAASYSVCLNMNSSGCRIIHRDVGTPIGPTGATLSYTLTASDLDAKPPFGDYYFRGKTMYWGIQACTEGNTSCVGTPSHRNVQVAPAPAEGGGTIPTVSFGQHLYPRIASNSCNACHSGGNLYPQNEDRPAICSVPGCGANTIPFTTAISAGAMLDRFKCLKACSQQVQYSQALGKVYVVPGTPQQSGLHHKAQESTAGAFGADVTIDGVTKSVRDWIEIWIEQGANP